MTDYRPPDLRPPPVRRLAIAVPTMMALLVVVVELAKRGVS